MIRILLGISGLPAPIEMSVVIRVIAQVGATEKICATRLAAAASDELRGNLDATLLGPLVLLAQLG